MKRDHSDSVKGFIHFGRSWWAKEGQKVGYGCTDEVMFGYYANGGGTSGEMAIRWHPLGRGQPTPRLEAFNDSWSALATFSDVVAALAEHDSERLTPEAVCKLLVSLGFKDLTVEHSPYEAKAK